MQIKFLSSFFAAARSPSTETNVESIKADPVELNSTELPHVAGGRGPAGTWAAATATTAQGPAGTW